MKICRDLKTFSLTVDNSFNLTHPGMKRRAWDLWPTTQFKIKVRWNPTDRQRVALDKTKPSALLFYFPFPRQNSCSSTCDQVKDSLLLERSLKAASATFWGVFIIHQKRAMTTQQQLSKTWDGVTRFGSIASREWTPLSAGKKWYRNPKEKLKATFAWQTVSIGDLKSHVLSAGPMDRPRFQMQSLTSNKNNRNWPSYDD